MPKSFKIICIALLALGLLSFAYPALTLAADDAAVSCRKGNVYCEYPGKCHDYIDLNNDNYCDRNVPSSGSQASAGIASTLSIDSSTGQSKAKTVSAAASESTSNGPADSSGAPGNSTPNDTSRYNLVLIMITLVIAYGITHLLSVKHIIKSSVHRKIWNIALLVSAAVMLVLGLLLTLREEYNLSMQMPFDLTFWHVETGIIMGIIAVFHIAWHWRYYFHAKPVT